MQTPSLGGNDIYLNQVNSDYNQQAMTINTQIPLILG